MTMFKFTCNGKEKHELNFLALNEEKAKKENTICPMTSCIPINSSVFKSTNQQTIGEFSKLEFQGKV